MSDMTYNRSVTPNGKPLVWMHAEVKSPPFSMEARLEAGFLQRTPVGPVLLGSAWERGRSAFLFVQVGYDLLDGF